MRRGEETQAMGALVCVECGCRSDEAARGWKAYLGGDSGESGEEEVEVVVLCPACAAREFGWRSQ
jgi:hypothetical protein